MADTLPAGYQLDPPAASDVKLPSGYALDGVATQATPAEQPSAMSRMWSSITASVPHPIDAIQEWMKRPSEIRSSMDALHVLNGVHAEAAKDPANAGKPVNHWKVRDLTPDEQAIVDKGMSAHLPGAEGNILADSTAPAVHAGGQAANGDLAGAAGTLIGGYGVPAAVGAAVPAAMRTVGKVAPKLYQSALKPGVADAATLPDVREQVNTGLQNGIPVTEAGTNKLRGLISDLGSKVQALVDEGSNAGRTVDPVKVASRVDELRPAVESQVNPEKDLATLDKSKAEFLDQHTQSTPASKLVDERGNPLTPAKKTVVQIPFGVAQDIKTGTYRQLSAKYGELGNAAVESQKALARGIKEEMEKQVPQLTGLNAEEGKALDLQGSLERAVRRTGNHDLVNLGDAAAGAGGAVAGGPVGAGAAAFLKKVLDSPGLKSNLAIAIQRASRRTPSPIGLGSAMMLAQKAFDTIAQPTDQKGGN